MPTTPKSWRLASATQALPGPVITSTRAMRWVPCASAAIACAPPMRQISSTPARCAAASTSGLVLPPGVGVTTASRSTPATLAGIAFISSEDG